MIKRVILDFDDRVMSIEDEEAEKWLRHVESVCLLAHTHGMNPFDSDPIVWEIAQKETRAL